MIVWLASYPRSGNTLLRMVLKNCFNLESYSLYSDQEFQSAAVRELVGEQAVGPDANSFAQKLRWDGRIAYVKTHELPANDANRTIYVVRDGRAALVSHFHYLRDIMGLRATLEELISGALFPSWSQHVSAWMLSGRTGVLPVRYEALAYGDHEVLEAISSFLGMPCVRPLSVSFAQLQNLMPDFFRSGSNSQNIAELTSAQMDMFDRLHGQVWRRLGYGSGREPERSKVH